MAAILELLTGSDDPEADRRLFLKAQILYWLLGATDGHAKNFSIFLYPGGRFRLTPIYDVLSTQPALDAGQLRRNQMKLALAVGHNRHYVVHDVLPRHFVQTVENCGIPGSVIESVCDELLETEKEAVGSVLESLPDDFPDELTRSIVDGFTSRMRLYRQAEADVGG